MKKWENCQIRAESDSGCLNPSRCHPVYPQVGTIPQVVKSRHAHNQRINLGTHPRGNPRTARVITRHDLSLVAPFVLVALMVHRSALKTLGTGDIAARTRVMVRKVKAKIDGKAKEGQVGGIEDPGAAARPVRKGGKATKDPREKRGKRLPMARDPPLRP